MKIAVNTRFLLPHKMEGFGWFTYETVSRMVRNHPEHEFVFFFDRKFDEKFIFADNVTPVVLHPQARHQILWKIWFNWSIKRALKKYNCDLLISTDGYASLTTDVPQIVVMHDLNFEHYPQDLPKKVLKYLQTNFPLFAKKAKRLITVSEFSKQDIAKTYKIDQSKIDVCYNGVDENFAPISEAEKIKFQTLYAKGKPYFLFVGSLHPRKNLIRLIAAFEKLKQENEIPHQLVIVGSAMWNDVNFEIAESVKSEIHFTGHLSKEELTQVYGAAFALTFVPYFEGFGIPIIEAMKSGIPVLSGNLTSLPEVGGDAALYCDPFNVDAIKDGMLELINNSKIREELIQKGFQRAKLFTWDNTANKMWDTVIKTMEE